MPTFDRKCTTCGDEQIDRYESYSTPDYPCQCGGNMARLNVTQQAGRIHVSKSSGVIGDEIDVYIKHALCHSDGSPRRFRSKTELRKAEQKAGVVNRVRHIGAPGSDRSKHTDRWV